MFRLMIVDDEPETCNNIYGLIRSCHYNFLEIKKTTSSKEAAKWLDEVTIDILLTDIKMPGFSGFELAEKAKITNENCKIVLLTGHNDFNYAYKALKDGCDDYILKINFDKEIDGVLKRLFRALNNVVTEKDDAVVDPKDPVKFIQHYITMHLSEDLSLAMLSKVVYLNPSYLSRIYRQSTGVKLSDYINQARVTKAKELLLKTCYKVQVISGQVGIESPVYFSRIFKKATGMTPQEYRKQHYRG